MLTVYTVRVSRQPEWIDLSGVPLNDLVDAALAVLAHQKTAVVWLGYLEGFMLSAQEETRLRPVLRAFPVISSAPIPFSFPLRGKRTLK